MEISWEVGIKQKESQNRNPKAVGGVGCSTFCSEALNSPSKADVSTSIMKIEDPLMYLVNRYDSGSV